MKERNPNFSAQDALEALVSVVGNEEEGGLFFEDHSNLPLQDDVLARLLMFPNVIVTAHQAFFTREAMNEIAQTTLGNVAAWLSGTMRNVVTAPG